MANGLDATARNPPTELDDVIIERDPRRTKVLTMGSRRSGILAANYSLMGESVADQNGSWTLWLFAKRLVPLVCMRAWLGSLSNKSHTHNSFPLFLKPASHFSVSSVVDVAAPPAV
jgi:hypothetical protein